MVFREAEQRFLLGEQKIVLSHEHNEFNIENSSFLHQFREAEPRGPGGVPPENFDMSYG
jgi:hypothetical protein